MQKCQVPTHFGITAILTVMCVFYFKSVKNMPPINVRVLIVQKGFCSEANFVY